MAMLLMPASNLTTRTIQTFCAALLLLALSVTFFFSSATRDTRLRIAQKLPLPTWSSGTNRFQLGPSEHPIDRLILNANEDFQQLLAKETSSLRDAAEAYRKRRGRQPPPGFDLWYEFARNNSAVMVEDFWDRIYHDLNPFWGVPSKQIRDQSNSFLYRISVRKGNVTVRTDKIERPWMELWPHLISTIAEWLPDMDLAINVLDETRLFVPWEDIDTYMTQERKSRKIVPEKELVDSYIGLAEVDAQQLPIAAPKWNQSGSMWPITSASCPPKSPARKTVAETDFSTPPPIARMYPRGSFEGYVSNITLATSPCDNPNLRGLHGSFIEPISIATSPHLIPMFGGSKLPMNNEILLPAAMYWSKDPLYSGGEGHGIPWTSKIDGMMWRGDASGGRNRNVTWKRFQRHRFIAMVNGTAVDEAEHEPQQQGVNFVLPESSYYGLAAHSSVSAAGDLGAWIKTWSNVATTNLLCFPLNKPAKKLCPYNNDYFTVSDRIPMDAQYDYKYLPDIDGNSFSGRYRGFLGSTSAPIKATIYQEWHDSRLVPWKHYIPMDNTFIDIYGIMQYFVGNKAAGIPDHDAQGEAIALEGKTWTEKVLRREDMQIYVFRLLLEYARVSDDNRNTMGWKESTSPFIVDTATVAEATVNGPVAA